MCFKTFSIVKWLVICHSMGLIPHCIAPAVQAHLEALEKVGLPQKLAIRRCQSPEKGSSSYSNDLLLLCFLVNLVPYWMGLKKENTPGDSSCISPLSFSPCSSPVMLKPRCHSVLHCSYCHSTQGAWHMNPKYTVQAQIRRLSHFQTPYNRGEKPGKTKGDKQVDGEQKETRSWCWLGCKTSIQPGKLGFFVFWGFFLIHSGESKLF